MTIHVTIGEAEKRLAELVAAVVRGEDVVLATAGDPQVRLVPVAGAGSVAADRVTERRRAGYGILAEAFEGFDLSLRALKSDRSDPDERYRLKFGPAD